MRRNEDGVTMVQSFEEIMAEWEAANGAHQEPLEIVAQATQAVQGQPQPPAHTAAFEMARRFLDIGYSLLPIQRDGSKRPAITGWKLLQSQHPTEHDLAEWFNDARIMLRAGGSFGIATIHGAISGNSECIDCDEGALWEAFYEQAIALVPKLAAAPVIKTPRDGGGFQLIYRNASRPSGNIKLAERPAPTPEQPNARKALIETRGEGGYTLTIGSPACCHPTGRCYQLIAGSFTTLPILTDDERCNLLILARSFTECPPRTMEEHHADVDWQKKRAEKIAALDAGTGEDVKPGDAYNREVSWTDILTPHGWTLLHTAADVGFWRRPGKTEPSPSATTNYKGCDLLYVFSSNAYPFEPETTYSKFAAFATLNCGGDYRLAAQRLARLGFGERVIDRRAK
jgi:hypothetical protein